MNFRWIAPRPAAAHIVDRYWTLDGDAAGAVRRVVPDGSPELILHLGNPLYSCKNGAWTRQPSCFIAGQLTAPLLLRGTGHANILGVTFRPEGLAALVGDGARELTGRLVDDLLTLRLPERPSIADLERELLRVAKHPADVLVGEAVRRLAASRGTNDIAVLARELGLSTRQMERRFTDQVGLAPKLYARMRRFQSVFPAIEAGSNWASAAAACGYYDQAHLIRDFREFAGEPPASLLARHDLARWFLSDRVSHFSNTPARAIR